MRNVSLLLMRMMQVVWLRWLLLLLLRRRRRRRLVMLLVMLLLPWLLLPWLLRRRLMAIVPMGTAILRGTRDGVKTHQTRIRSSWHRANLALQGKASGSTDGAWC